MSYIPDAQVLGYRSNDNLARATYRQYEERSRRERVANYPKGYSYEGKESAESDRQQANLWLTTFALRNGDLKALRKLKKDNELQMPHSIQFVLEDRNIHLYKWLEDNGYPFCEGGRNFFFRLMKDNTTETRYVCNHDGKGWVDEKLCTQCPEATKNCNKIYKNSDY